MDNQLKEQVIAVLKDNPPSRNSDITLMIEIWKRFYPGFLADLGESAPLKNLYELPREDNIKRIRAKLSEEALKRINKGNIKYDEVYYLPTDDRVAARRKINEALWQKALGYFKAPMKQTEQLPRPVGAIGFSRVTESKFLVNGAKGKKYQVEANENGFISCECEAYRYSTKKACKHTLEIKSYLLKVAKIEAAKTQTNLF